MLNVREIGRELSWLKQKAAHALMIAESKFRELRGAWPAHPLALLCTPPRSTASAERQHMH